MSFVVLEAQGRTEMKDKDSPTVRVNRELDLAEQEGLQTACIPGACDGNMSNYFMICNESGKEVWKDWQCERPAAVKRAAVEGVCRRVTPQITPA